MNINIVLDYFRSIYDESLPTNLANSTGNYKFNNSPVKETNQESPKNYKIGLSFLNFALN